MHVYFSSVQKMKEAVNDRGSIPGRGRDFFVFSTASVPAPWPTKHRMKWVLVLLPRG